MLEKSCFILQFYQSCQGTTDKKQTFPDAATPMNVKMNGNSDSEDFMEVLIFVRVFYEEEG